MFGWLKRLFGTSRSESVTREVHPNESSAPPRSPDTAAPRTAMPPTRAESPSRSGRDRPALAIVHIGLDWGTHSTKVVIRRDEETERGELLAVLPAPDESVRNGHAADAPYPWFAIPSVVGVRDGRLVFGDAARALPLESKHYTLKATLIKGTPSVAPAIARPLNAKDADEVVDILAVAFVAWVLQHVRVRIDDLIGAGRWKPFVSMSAPMDRVEDPELKRRYERILNAAWLAAFRNGGGINLEGAELATFVRQIRELLGSQLDDDGDRLFAVLPETIAGLVPLMLEPRREEGIYNVIDIGGGSTEVSIVQLSDLGHGIINCVADKSIRVGALDLRDGAATGTDSPLESIRATLCEQWFDGYQRECRNRVRVDAWAKNVVLKAGGGWASGRIEERLATSHPWRDYFAHRISGGAFLRFVPYQPSSDLLSIAGSPHAKNGSNTRELFHLLPVALGLSLYPDWPKSFAPVDRLAVPPDPRSVLEPDATHGHS